MRRAREIVEDNKEEEEEEALGKICLSQITPHLLVIKLVCNIIRLLTTVICKHKKEVV